MRILIDSFHLQAKWDQNNQLLSMEHESFLQGDEAFHYMRSDDYHQNEDVADLDTIMPLRYDIEFTQGNVLSTIMGKGTLKITAKNLSGKGIHEGREDLHRVYIYKRDGAFHIEQDPTAPPYVQNRKRSEVAKDAEFVSTTSFTAQPQDQLEYILVSGRVLKKPIQH